MRFALILIAALLAFSLFRAWQSETIKRQADELLAQGDAKDAIAAFETAQKIFPLRSDLADDIAGAKLVEQSNVDYSQIAQFVGELQEVPPLANLPKITLKANEVFIPVLMYHHIRINPKPGDPVWAALNVTPNQLEQQLSYLNSHGFHSITLDELTQNLENKTSLPSKPIILSFDDGYRNFYSAAFPLLKKYNAKAVQFVITQVVDTAPYLTWDQIKEMDQSDLVQFGAHTQHHPNLPDLNQTAIVNEIKGSKFDLESHLGKTINWFAYPYGSYNNFIIQTVKDAGFKGAASTIYGAAQSQEKLYLLPRIMVDGRFTLDNLTARIQQ